MKDISSCLWFNNQAEEAAQLYTTVFPNSKIEAISRYTEASAQKSGLKPGSVLTVALRLENLRIQALNGGPVFSFTPALSFFVSCSSEAEIDQAWNKLSQGGQPRMELGKYPWAEKYGWTSDKYGMEWQLILAPSEFKIVPSLLFVDELFGKGEEALNYYLSIFPNSKIRTLARDEANKTIAHCAFTLNGHGFALMEGQGKHGYTFTPAHSLSVSCDDQQELDYFWEKLSAGGTIQQCGWLTDKFGVSWQVVPKVLPDLMTTPGKSEKVMSALLQMKKIDIETLVQAAR